mmetsp:Transcript_25992/g.37289  ORF Transcript_25992/g.37289 Transcript_25992/m.37289 type:complete len:100 (-) Transcript_25992:1103-1402(-)
MVGLQLTRLLRLHPMIISLWCLQLSVCMYGLANCSGSFPVSQMDVSKSVYVRQDGRLLLGDSLLIARFGVFQCEMVAFHLSVSEVGVVPFSYCLCHVDC